MIFKFERGNYVHRRFPDAYVEIIEVIKEYPEKVHLMTAIRKKLNDEIIKEGEMWIQRTNFRDWFYYYQG